MILYPAKGKITYLNFRQGESLKLILDKISQAKITLMIILGQSYKYKTKIIMKRKKWELKKISKMAPKLSKSEVKTHISS